jgi:chromate reductase
MGTVRAQWHLRQIMGVLGMSMVSQPEVLIGLAREKFGHNGALVEEKARELLAALMKRLVAMAWAAKIGG